MAYASPMARGCGPPSPCLKHQRLLAKCTALGLYLTALVLLNGKRGSMRWATSHRRSRPPSFSPASTLHAKSGSDRPAGATVASLARKADRERRTRQDELRGAAGRAAWRCKLDLRRVRRGSPRQACEQGGRVEVDSRRDATAKEDPRDP